MKKYYTLICIILMSLMSSAQNYELALVHLNDYDFKIVAIPGFTSSGNTDVSDVGFTLVLPTGASDIINQSSMLPGRTWSVSQFDATFLTSLGLGDGTKDVFQFNMPPGQSILSHTSGEHIDLISFQVSNTPTEGEITFLLNSDPIAIGAGGVLDSFYNSDIDGPGTGAGTTDYFSGIASGLDSFMFSTLSNEVFEVESFYIDVYPNPVKDKLFIRSNTNIDTVILFDLQGKSIYSSKNETTLDVSNLSNGMYLISITSGEKRLTQKIVINN